MLSKVITVVDNILIVHGSKAPEPILEDSFRDGDRQALLNQMQKILFEVCKDEYRLVWGSVLQSAHVGAAAQPLVYF